MLDQFDQKYMIFQHMGRFSQLPHFLDLFPHNRGVWAQAGEIATYVSNILEKLVDVNAMKKDEDPQVIAIANVMEEYEKILREENLLDFTSIQTDACDTLSFFRFIFAIGS